MILAGLTTPETPTAPPDYTWLLLPLALVVIVLLVGPSLMRRRPKAP
jgi:hypothetical protein